MVWWWWRLFPRLRGFGGLEEGGGEGHSFPACALKKKKKKLVEISSHTPIPLFRSGSVYSGTTSEDDCGRVFPEELRVSNFPARLPHYAWAVQSAHSYFVGSGMYACLSITCHLYFWQNGQALLRTTAVTRGGTDSE